MGETVDDALGETFDKVGKLLGLPYPGGPHIEKLALKGNPKAYDFPRPMIHNDNLDMSLSGLKTAVLYKIQKIEDINQDVKADIAASFQKAVTDVLIAKIKKTIEKTNRSDVIIAGGVAANKYIRKKFKELENALKIRVYYPDLKYCGDNAAMIAFVGSMMTPLKEKNIKSKVRARWPLNELKP